MITEQETDSHIMVMGTPRRIWAISAIHGEIEKLMLLHDSLFPHFKTGDRLVYTGNYSGYGNNSAAVIEELLAFRRSILSIPGVIPTDIIYLRGGQEEMLHKLLQLPFAPNPAAILTWMLNNGLDKTLHSYGLSHAEGLEACRWGTHGLTRWANAIREAIRQYPGHEIFNNHLARAAYTAPKETENPLLFVNAGLDANKPLEQQGDSFWWEHQKFERMENVYAPFRKVVRGYDPDHKGMHLNCITATIDGGCGFGGNLVCAGFEGNGTYIDSLQI